MSDDFLLLLADFILLELCRQNDIPLTGDFKVLNKYYPCVLTVHF